MSYTEVYNLQKSNFLSFFKAPREAIMNKKLTKNNLKKKKLNSKNILLVISMACLAIAIYFIYQFVFVAGAERLFYSKFPEIPAVANVVKDRYRDGDVLVNVNWNTVYVEGEKKTTSSVVVVYQSQNSLTDKDMQDIAKLACNKLEQINKHYDKVVVVSRKNMLPINIPFFHFVINETHSEKCK
jgi:hypothetical protein